MRNKYYCFISIISKFKFLLCNIIKNMDKPGPDPVFLFQGGAEILGGLPTAPM